MKNEITLFTAIDKMYNLAEIIEAHTQVVRTSQFLAPAPQAYHDLKAEIVTLLNSVSLKSIDATIWTFLRQNHLPAIASLYRFCGNNSQNMNFFIYDLDSAYGMDIPQEDVHADFNTEKYEAFKAQELIKW